MEKTFKIGDCVITHSYETNFWPPVGSTGTIISINNEIPNWCWYNIKLNEPFFTVNQKTGKFENIYEVSLLGKYLRLIPKIMFIKEWMNLKS